MRFYEELKLCEDLENQAKSNGADLEDIIDNMMAYNRYPKLPNGWMINDIDDDDDVSRISFEYKKQSYSIWFYVKYNEGNGFANSNYEIDYELMIDYNDTYSHASETFRPNPEGCVKRIFEIVGELHEILISSTTDNLQRNLKIAGYKKQ